MKNILIKFICICFLHCSINAQSNISNYDAKNIAAVFIANINGSIKVNGTKSNTVNIETSNYKMKDGFIVHKFMYNDTLVVVMEDKTFSVAECDSDYIFPRNIMRRNCNTNSNPDLVDIEISVPSQMMVKASTYNEGDILFSDVSGLIVAKNLNGHIKLYNVSYVESAHTLNGDLDVTLDKQPQSNGKFFSLNGDINIVSENKLDVDLTFKSMNGEFFTNIEDLHVDQSNIESIKSNHKFKIKLDKKTFMTAGNGGVLLELETLNGDAILKTLEL